MSNQPETPLWEKILLMLAAHQEVPSSWWEELSEDERLLLKQIQRSEQLDSSSQFLMRLDDSAAWTRFYENIDSSKEWRSKSSAAEEEVPNAPKRSLFFQRYWAAASILIVLTASIVFYLFNTSTESLSALSDKGYLLDSVQHQRATLVLEDGTEVDLEGKGIDSSLAKTNRIQGIQSGLLAYHSGALKAGESASSLPADVRWHRIRVPRGGMYAVTLEDGTKVWLNAQSELRYPNSFYGQKSRRVELVSGEAYFDVAKSTSQPFYVQHKNSLIRVMGTSFNLNTYEPTFYTTLVEGRVQVFGFVQPSNVLDWMKVDFPDSVVRKGGAFQVLDLLPGSQSEYKGGEKFTSGTRQVFQQRRVDVETYVSWKDGYMLFEEASLEQVMHFVERWYDIDVEYENEAIKGLKFGGKISRYQRVEDVLRIIRRAGQVEFQLSSEKIIVIPKRK